MQWLSSRSSAPSLFDELDLCWRNLCFEFEAAEGEILECLRAAELARGANTLANDRLDQARLRSKKVQHEMRRFLDLLDQGKT